eukprot:TRINITY_DN31267_c0_g1_i6.p3 TRINITY_DN31267_c0_g1~~TRINITY_DN31267_c0_g1_i6.p3  ORF type:complete len:245 (-),score=51.42 TRINITY_DN31267_c0_g1_i6:86-820(-)
MDGQGLNYFGGASEQTEEASESSDLDSSQQSENDEQEHIALQYEEYEIEKDEQLNTRGTATRMDEQNENGLISAENAFGEILGPPSFLDPEAVRPIAHRVPDSSRTEQNTHEQEVSQRKQKRKRKQIPDEDFDISKLAPPLKQNYKEHVIQSKAVKYREEKQGRQAAIGPHPEQDLCKDGNNRSVKNQGPIEVSEFLHKGEGVANLPRKGQDRREKEKQKRKIGQSSANTWKSEAEMVLRQQYD